MLVLLLLAACSRAVEVPREQFEATARTHDADHRIQTTEGETYLAARFSVADSLLTIDQISPSDKQYAQATLPIPIALADVASVYRIENRPPTYVALAAVGLFVLVVAIVSGGDAFTD